MRDDLTPQEKNEIEQRIKEMDEEHKAYTGFNMFRQPLGKERLTDEQLAERKRIKEMNIGWKDNLALIIAAFSVILPYFILLVLIFVGIYFLVQIIL